MSQVDAKLLRTYQLRLNKKTVHSSWNLEVGNKLNL